MTGWRRRTSCGGGSNLCCDSGNTCDVCDCPDTFDLSITFPATSVHLGCGLNSGVCQSFPCLGWTSTATLTRQEFNPCRWETGHIDVYCHDDIDAFRSCTVHECDASNCDNWYGDDLYVGISCGNGVCSSMSTTTDQCDDEPPWCIAAAYACGNMVAWRGTLTYNAEAGTWRLKIEWKTASSLVQSNYNCLSETWGVTHLSAYSDVACGADWGHMDAFQWEFSSPCTAENLCMDTITDETFSWLNLVQCGNDTCGECDDTIDEYLAGYFPRTPPPATEPTYTIT